MRIGVPREIHAGERRVATTPDVAAQLIKLGYDVAIERNAGAAADFSDAAYEAAGCEVVATASDIWSTSDIVMKVRGPDGDEEGPLDEDGVLALASLASVAMSVPHRDSVYTLPNPAGT